MGPRDRAPLKKEEFPVFDRALIDHPLPVADAVAALAAAESIHERRDRLVEAFRALLRYLALLALAARRQYGAGPGEAPRILGALRAKLLDQGLTDGEWWGLLLGLLSPWARAPQGHPLAELVELLHGSGRARVVPLVEALLAMRRKETVAHGTTGDADDVEELTTRRLRELASLLEAVEPLWRRLRLVVPLPGDSEAPQAWLLMGDTPNKARWRRVRMAGSALLKPGEPALLDDDGRPLLALWPLALVRRAAPDLPEELFVFDRIKRRSPVYLALPSTSEHHAKGGYDELSALLGAQECDEPGPAGTTVDRPFRGLESFERRHEALFFGRSELVEDLANHVRQSRFVVVTGPSGAGKTSLLQAGLGPSLERGPHEGARFKLLLLRPGLDPAEAVVRALAVFFEQPAEPFAAAVRGEASLGELVAGLGRALGIVPVLVLDQAEELLTLCRDDGVRHRVTLALSSLVSDGDGARVVLSVREDFLVRLVGQEPLYRLLQRYPRQVIVSTPDREALLRTLEGPAKEFGCVFEDSALMEEMVDAVAGTPSALALLQFTADRMWEMRDRTWKRLTWESYQALGGIHGALARHAEETLLALTVSQQRMARAILLRLVTEEGTRAIVLRREFIDASRQDAELVLSRLEAARLIVARGAEEDGREATEELVHEALLTHWERLARWRAEDREGHHVLHALRLVAAEWEKRGKNADLLWRGDVLAEYRAWRRRAEIPLTPGETAFALASERSETSRRWWRRGAIASSLAFLLGVLVIVTGALVTTQQSLQREEHARAETEQAVRRADTARIEAETAEKNVQQAAQLLVLSVGSSAQAAQSFAKASAVPRYRPLVIDILKPMINEAESVDGQERDYWFQIMPTMTEAQLVGLMKILAHEKIELRKLDEEYEAELQRLDQKHQAEWEEFERSQKRKLRAGAPAADLAKARALLSSRGADRRKKARDLLETMLKQQPEQPDVVFELARLDEREKEYKRAAAAFQKLVDRFPEETSYLDHLGHSLFHAERYSEALSSFRALAEHLPMLPAGQLDPARQDALRMAALCQQRLGDISGATETLSRRHAAARLAFDASPAPTARIIEAWQQATHALTNLLFEQERYAEAAGLVEELLRRVLALNAETQYRTGPSFLAREYNSLCWVRLFLKDFEGARDACNRGLEQQPSAYLHGNLAHALLLHGNYEQARAIYLGNRCTPVGDRSWSSMVQQDFALLRRAGIAHPDMELISRALGLVASP